MGIAFQQRPQLTHQCVSFRSRNSRQDLQQAVDALLWKGALERVTDVTFLGYYSRLFLVPQKTRDFHPVDIRYAYLHVLMHKAVRKYLCFVVNKQVYHFTCLPFGLATSPREFTQRLRPVMSLLRQRGVKRHVYFDVWPNCMHRRPSVCSSFTAGSSTTRSQTSLLVGTSSASGCSSTLDSSQWRPYRRCVSKSRPFTNTG